MTVTVRMQLAMKVRLVILEWVSVKKWATNGLTQMRAMRISGL